MTLAQERPTCADVSELAGLYVLDALDADEHETVRAHLATCDQVHDELAEVGGVVPALAMLIEPLEAPVELKARVMAAIATAEQLPKVAPMQASMPTFRTVIPAPKPALPRPSEPAVPHAAYLPARQTSWSRWALGIAAVAMIAVLGSWSIVLQSRASEAEQRSGTLARAIAASNDVTAQVAVLRGTGIADGATGFAAFPREGPGYIVMVGLRPAPSGHTYQAWYMVDGQPSSAGLMVVGQDGIAVLQGVQPIGTNLVALTLEPAGGVDQPTTDPVVTGEVAAQA